MTTWRVQTVTPQGFVVDCEDVDCEDVDCEDVDCEDVDCEEQRGSPVMIEGEKIDVWMGAKQRRIGGPIVGVRYDRQHRTIAITKGESK